MKNKNLIKQLKRLIERKVYKDMRILIKELQGSSYKVMSKYINEDTQNLF